MITKVRRRRSRGQPYTATTVLTLAGISALAVPAILYQTDSFPWLGLLFGTVVAWFDAEIGWLRGRAVGAAAFRFSCWVLAGLWGSATLALGRPAEAFWILAAALVVLALIAPAFDRTR